MGHQFHTSLVNLTASFLSPRSHQADLLRLRISQIEQSRSSYPYRQDHCWTWCPGSLLKTCQRNGTWLSLPRTDLAQLKVLERRCCGPEGFWYPAAPRIRPG